MLSGGASGSAGQNVAGASGAAGADPQDAALPLQDGGGPAAAGKPEKTLAVMIMFGGMALAAFATNLLRSPRWARDRQGQIEATAEQVVRLLSKP
jgi:hypothetical protein